MTTEVEDKKPENCKKVESCAKMKFVDDKEAVPGEYREEALAICAKCDEFEERS